MDFKSLIYFFNLKLTSFFYLSLIYWGKLEEIYQKFGNCERFVFSGIT